MANIQSGINQFISQAAIFGRLAPGFNTRQKLAELQKTKSDTEKQKKYTMKAIK